MAGEILARSLLKFNGNNFQHWKFQISNALIAHDLIGYIDGTTQRPQSLNDDAGKAWVKGNAKAMFLLYAAIEEEEMNNLLICVTAKEMWDCLSTVHEQKSESHKLLLSQRFHEHRMDTNESVVAHISKVQNLARQLLDIRENISDSQVMAKILASLPSKYRNFRTTWNSIEERRQTIEFLQARLIEEEEYLNADEQETSALAATSKKDAAGGTSNPRKKKGKNFRKSKSHVKCFVCDEQGHYARECPKSKHNRANYNSSGSNYSNGCALVATYKAENREQGDSKQEWFWEPTSEQKRALLNTRQEEIWYTDSGASAHILFRKDWFVEYWSKDDGSTITLGDGRECRVRGEGTIHIERLIHGVWTSAHIEKVLYVPEMGKNLYSVGQATARGLEIRFKGDNVYFLSGDEEVIAAGLRQGNLIYRMFFRGPLANQLEVTVAEANFEKWHERLGHLNSQAMEDLIAKYLVSGVKVKGAKNDFFCEGCQVGKSHKLPFKKESARIAAPGKMIHSDVCGPMQETSLEGARFYVSFIDDATGYRHVNYIKYKSDVFDRFVVFEKKIRNKFGRCMKILRTDNGKEYVNERMSTYMQSLGITHERTAPYTPEQNGKAERENRTIVECARTLLKSTNLPGSLWAEATNCVVYTLNRVLTPTRDRSKTSYELWMGKRPNLEHMKTFGADAYQLLPKSAKFEKTAKPMKLVGYEEDTTNYRLYCPTKRQVVVSRHVRFNEHNKEVVPLTATTHDDAPLFHYTEPAAPEVEEDVGAGLNQGGDEKLVVTKRPT